METMHRNEADQRTLLPVQRAAAMSPDIHGEHLAALDISHARKSIIADHARYKSSSRRLLALHNSPPWKKRAEECYCTSHPAT